MQVGTEISDSERFRSENSDFGIKSLYPNSENSDSEFFRKKSDWNRMWLSSSEIPKNSEILRSALDYVYKLHILVWVVKEDAQVKTEISDSESFRSEISEFGIKSPHPNSENSDSEKFRNRNRNYIPFRKVSKFFRNPHFPIRSGRNTVLEIDNYVV